MAKTKECHSEMAHARQSDGINVIFDQSSPSSSPSSRSRGRVSHRGRNRSSSSSSSGSRSASNPRSRSHPRCHRRSSRCRCDNHNRNRSRHHRKSYNRSPSADRKSHRRSRSRSTGRLHRNRRVTKPVVSRSSRSPAKIDRIRSRSRSSGSSVSLSSNDKRELLEVAKANAQQILGVETLELPESVTPILSELSEQSVESKWVSPELSQWVRQDPERTSSQSNEEDSDDMSSPKMSPKRKITFSINNALVKPTVAAPSSAKVTPRVDIYQSRKPYGHWVPVKSGHTSKSRKHTHAMSR